MPGHRNGDNVARMEVPLAAIHQTSTAQTIIARSSDNEFMVGDSQVMRDVFDKIRRQAPTSAPILITGESGTGKELAARAIHQRSAFREGRFVAINCASLPATLIASELFGYEKGAFTGANTRKIGLVELADKGTLFLDEIGDLPFDLQGHLLRFLQEGTIVRVGGHQPISVSARIISATHVDLRQAIENGKFREDLYYRLNVLPLHLPSLRERDGDLQLLAKYFLDTLSVELGHGARGFTADAQALIETYHWPGNIREMIAAIRRGIVMGHGNLISAADLALEPWPTSPKHHQFSLSVSDRRAYEPGSDEERKTLEDALSRCQYNLSRTARVLKVSRVTLYRMLKRHAMSRNTMRER
ncbi:MULTISPECIES: sigma-54-dependent Fis family transcriptional regulator [unclassified Acidocella]|uniref:sigma-54 interaction domain-containing protein n=1 Tax=unclassified Acidocella TaxID=2648610 RepID=UPI00028E2B2F|nr:MULTISPECIES: sigma-54 dependent transcriptional regulator [unclassified Acidocella]EKM98113.1 Fis family transcriptional regulator [Acidocella sp. MX-AZ02]WBO59436.1 sigma-54 dependent transcriptional regulator [Acidocella sp. MX-AZ03]